MQNFIKELRQIERRFIESAKRDWHNVDMESYRISICNRYLSIRIEAEDIDGDTVVIKQEIEQFNDGLFPGGISYQY